MAGSGKEPRWEPPQRTTLRRSVRTRTPGQAGPERTNHAERPRESFGYLRNRRLGVRVDPRTLWYVIRTGLASLKPSPGALRGAAAG